MKTGSAEGQRWSIRAKIAYDDLNGALRDPVIYRCNLTPHHRTGTAWNIYPTYDFACPVVDALEGVTHALRTTEYNDRDAQYEWMQRVLGQRRVHIVSFARLNLRRTLLSKRKLAAFVAAGLVTSWADPRMPTVRGLQRRGLRMPALRAYILAQGPSRNVVNQDWAALWAVNKAHVDPGAGRYTAIAKKDAVACRVAGVGAARAEEQPLHARHALGRKRVVLGPDVLVEQADAALLRPGEQVTLMGWGNAVVRRVERAGAAVCAVDFALRLDARDFRSTRKIHWLSTAQELVDVQLVDFDFLITKDKVDKGDEIADVLASPTEFREEAWADCNVAALPEDAVLQFDRKAYYRVDRPSAPGLPAVMFRVPTGRN